MKVHKVFCWSLCFVLASCSAGSYYPSLGHEVHNQAVGGSANRAGEVRSGNYPRMLQAESLVGLGLNLTPKQILADSADVGGGDRAPYQVENFPVDLSIQNISDWNAVQLGAGLSTDEGLRVSLGVFPVRPIGLHAWASSFMVVNHKIGAAVTLSPVHFLSLGYGVNNSTAYAYGCSGSCGLGSFPTIASSRWVWQHFFDFAFGIDQVFLYGKYGFSSQFKDPAFHIGLNFKYHSNFYTQME